MNLHSRTVILSRVEGLFWGHGARSAELRRFDNQIAVEWRSVIDCSTSNAAPSVSFEVIFVRVTVDAKVESSGGNGFSVICDVSSVYIGSE